MNAYSIALFLHSPSRPAWPLPWHRLSQDRQARLRRIAHHDRRSDRSRPCLSPAHAPP